MKGVGIDVGSLTTKVVVMEGEDVLFKHLSKESERAELLVEAAIRKVLNKCGLKRDDISRVVATGSIQKDASFVEVARSAFVCLARGARRLYPEARSIIEVGAENVNVISLDKKGRINDYMGNDRCAAGGGIFLTSMAKALGLSMEAFVGEAMGAEKSVPISTTCTIFAEQEVLSYAFENPPLPRDEIIAGLHDSLASRVSGLALRAGIVFPVVICGGVARNAAFLRSLNKRISGDFWVVEEPEFVSALGAAIVARKEKR